MKILLHDASILIDVIYLGLLKLVLKLPFFIQTTDLVVNELKDPDQSAQVLASIKSEEIQVLRSSSSDLMAMVLFRHEQSGLSLPDCSVLYHAKIQSAIVLSADKLIRNTAHRHSLDVHGILWILDELIKEQLLSSDSAIVHLEKLMKKNDRLPLRECERKIQNWQQLGLTAMNRVHDK